MYQKRILPNGLTLIIAPLANTKTLTTLLLARAGSRYEVKSQNGISHFVEHLMFKGTRRHPTTLALSRELDAVGADYNAFTSKDHTGYYIKTGVEHSDLAINLLAEMIFTSLFSAVEIEREKGVIIEEMNMFRDNPLLYVEDLAEQLIFQGQALGWLVIGQKAAVSQLTRAQLMAYRQNFYQPENLVLTLAGRVTPQTIALAERIFGRPKSTIRQTAFSPFNRQTNVVGQRYLVKATDQVQLALGWQSCGYDAPALEAVYLLATILGGHMSSRLFIEVRERRGLAYYVKAAQNSYQDTGCLLIQAGLDKKRCQAGLDLILNQVELIKRRGVTTEELRRAKDFLRGKLALDLEDSAHLAEWYGRQQLLMAKVLTPESKLKKIMAVTANQVQAAAQEIFVQNKLNLATIGPVRRLRF